MSLVAIHQPNFFPWLGYFDKIRRADIFILLDDVQYQKTGGTWSNRVRLLINGEGRWLTAPLERNFHGMRAINQMVFSDKDDWRGRVLRTIHSAYRRAAYFSEVWRVVEPLIANPAQNLAEFNIHAITAMANAMRLDTSRFVRSSSLPTGSTATHRLIDLTRSVGGGQYLCGGGAGGYQDDQAFKDAGIVLAYQGFSPAPYPQQGGGAFVAGLSAIDAAMNVGWAGIQSLLVADESA